ncbi:hypothetical protein ASC84_04680 [Acinetobacter sp. Root1280]|uniref:hypothetical protein n=1 Tax=Acinetobacter sp. Root1280 TaxID=1736444 RepID=UPI0006F99B74|nr:hypothetical protein [Acinetobacter sp. Root1280]KQW98052.1 hypothetical protein ASC84_04680 [Acinetobacter sp. Root1280]
MLLVQVKALIHDVSLKLEQTSKAMYRRDLVTTSDHQKLGEINNALTKSYDLLDVAFQEDGYKNTNFDEVMEYTELVRKRIAALAEYIRPYRLKNEHVSPSTVVTMINKEQQAIHHLVTLLNELTGVSQA